MWKAFQELQEIGWLSGRLPRMVAVQASGCAPIVKAFNEGAEFAELWKNAHGGGGIPGAGGGGGLSTMLRAIREAVGSRPPSMTMRSWRRAMRSRGAKAYCCARKGRRRMPRGSED
ncbi:MAG: hypothetical protein U0992_13490 [Planctomycetaceae bacterium]